MDVAAALRWDRLWELQYPEHVFSSLHELNKDNIAHVPEELLILDVHILKLLVNLSRDRVEPRFRFATLLLNFDHSFCFLLREAGLCNATSHVLFLVHLTNRLQITSHDDLVLERLWLALLLGCLVLFCSWHIFSRGIRGCNRLASGLLSSHWRLGCHLDIFSSLGSYSHFWLLLRLSLNQMINSLCWCFHLKLLVVFALLFIIIERIGLEKLQFSSHCILSEIS